MTPLSSFKTFPPEAKKYGFENGRIFNLSTMRELKIFNNTFVISLNGKRIQCRLPQRDHIVFINGVQMLIHKKGEPYIQNFSIFAINKN